MTYYLKPYCFEPVIGLPVVGEFTSTELLISARLATIYHFSAT